MKEILHGMGNLIYFSIIDGSPKTTSLGFIWMQDQFKEVFISVNQYPSDIMIVAPAHSVDEALNIASRYLKMIEK